MTPRYNTLKILARILADNVRHRYRPAETDEASHALDDVTALLRANDDIEEGTRSEESVSAMTLAAIMLAEPRETETTFWVPRPNMLRVDRNDDIETLAKIIADEFLANHVEHDVEWGEYVESLVEEVVNRDDYASNEIFETVCGAVCKIVHRHGERWVRPDFFDAEPS